MAKAEIEVGLRFEGAVVRPGDTLVVVVREGLSPAVGAELNEKLRAAVTEYLPGVKVALMTGADQVLVYRPDEEPRWPMKAKTADRAEAA